ncbi:hypothetical protein [uncultured Paludibaculum sp.]|uniref:hypothetical protein n=1 Tax=uncultured Paludibaculum sp. TaxID=1765020 RepID=UPI002AAB912E|nr:hypothetical protein [uncultured Paludibaculum sp.]
MNNAPNIEPEFALAGGCQGPARVHRRRQRPKPSSTLLGLLVATVGRWTLALSFLCLAPLQPPALAAKLTPETLRAWDTYIHTAQSSLETRAQNESAFLCMDDDRECANRVRQGETIVKGNGPSSIPGGMIHDWSGAIFIPRVSLRDVLQIVQDYDRYMLYYPPEVLNSSTLGGTGEYHRSSMRWLKKVLFVTAVFDTEHSSRYVALDANRMYSIDRTTLVQEVENYGRGDERKLPAGTGHGYLWHVYTISRYEQRDGGVYLEMRVIGLTRDVPASVRWLVNPIIGRLPRELLRTTLTQTRDAVLTLAPTQKGLQSSDHPAPQPTDAHPRLTPAAMRRR